VCAKGRVPSMAAKSSSCAVVGKNSRAEGDGPRQGWIDASTVRSHCPKVNAEEAVCPGAIGFYQALFGRVDTIGPALCCMLRGTRWIGTQYIQPIGGRGPPSDGRWVAVLLAVLN